MKSTDIKKMIEFDTTKVTNHAKEYKTFLGKSHSEKARSSNPVYEQL